MRNSNAFSSIIFLYVMALIVAAVFCVHCNAQGYLKHTDINNSTATKVEKPRRDCKPLLAIAGASAFELLASRYDSKETAKGVKDGVAYEGNTWLLGTNTPSYSQLRRRDYIEFSIMVSPSLVTWVFRKKAATYALTTPLIADGIGHIHGGNMWKSLINQQK